MSQGNLGFAQGVLSKQEKLKREDQDEQERLRLEERQKQLDTRQAEEDAYTKDRRAVEDAREDTEYNQRQEDRTRQLGLDDVSQQQANEDRAHLKKTRGLDLESSQLKLSKDKMERERLIQQADNEGAAKLIETFDQTNDIAAAVDVYNRIGQTKILPETLQFDPNTGEIYFKESDNTEFKGTIDQMRQAIQALAPKSKKGMSESERLNRSKFSNTAAQNSFGGKDFVDSETGPQVAMVSALADALLDSEQGKNMTVNQAAFLAKQAVDQKAEGETFEQIQNRLLGVQEKKQAPAGAIAALKNNPSLKQAFLDKYGYLPEGINTAVGASR